MAGRIPQAFIDDLISRVDIVDLIDGFVPLKKAGKDYKACCPFHGEKTPSFTVSQEKQFYHCFGCGVHGTAIGFLIEYDQLSFVEAVEQLANKCGLTVPTDNFAASTPAPREGPDLYELLEKANDFYQQQLKTHADSKTAVDYLKNRGLDGEIAKRFGVGLAPEGWDNLMQHFGDPSNSNEKINEALLTAGLLSKNEKGRMYDRFRGRIMFPIHDYRGRMVGFGGRIINEGEPKYLNSPETPVFHKGSELYGLYLARTSIRDTGHSLVVEGYMDVVALAQNGIDFSVATLGTATTKAHLDRLFRHAPEVIFCFDGDRAGKEAAWRALENALPAMQDGRQASFMFLPDGEDPDTLVRKVGKEEFTRLIESAKPLPEYLIDSLSAQADLTRMDGSARLAKLAQPLLERLPQGVLRQLIKQRIEQLVGTQISIAAAAPTGRAPSRREISRGTAQQGKTDIQQAIGYLLQHPELAARVNDTNTLRDSELPGFGMLADIAESIQQSPAPNTAALLERFRERKEFPRLESLASWNHIYDDEAAAEAFDVLLNNFATNIDTARLNQLLEKAKESLTSDEKEEIKKLLHTDINSD
ncbi:MAG: DNA primase [Proteobacteria bacterium]|jgi:DNA primase|nr:DNA primase [Pseudomonadota bacterium]